MIMAEVSGVRDSRFRQGIEFLSEQGINLSAVLDCNRLPDAIAESMHTAQIPFTDYKSLVLLGSAAQQLWQALTTFGFKTDDPIDFFAQSMTQRFVEEYLLSLIHI